MGSRQARCFQQARCFRQARGSRPALQGSDLDEAAQAFDFRQPDEQDGSEDVQHGAAVDIAPAPGKRRLGQDEQPQQQQPANGESGAAQIHRSSFSTTIGGGLLRFSFSATISGGLVAVGGGIMRRPRRYRCPGGGKRYTCITTSPQSRSSTS